jgi:hypothetical protein
MTEFFGGVVQCFVAVIGLGLAASVIAGVVNGDRS